MGYKKFYDDGLFGETADDMPAAFIGAIPSALTAVMPTKGDPSTREIFSVYSYHVIGRLGSPLIVRADEAVGVSTLLAMGCTASNLAYARIESPEEACTRLYSGVSDDAAALVLFETPEALLNGGEQACETCDPELLQRCYDAVHAKAVSVQTS